MVVISDPGDLACNSTKTYVSDVATIVGRHTILKRFYSRVCSFSLIYIVLPDRVGVSSHVFHTVSFVGGKNEGAPVTTPLG